MKTRQFPSRALIPFGFSVLMFLLMLGALGARPEVALAQPLHDAVSGNITTTTTWWLANSPYTLTNDVIVNAGVTLTIEPGVIVRGQGNTELKVLGHLDAIGTPSLPITFTSATDSGPYQWSGLVFDGGTGDLRHATVRYGGNTNSVLGGGGTGSNLTARNVLTGQLNLESCRVLTETYAGYGYVDYGLYVLNSRVMISDTLFSGDGNDAFDYALYATGASTVLTITHSTFQNNSGYPLRVEASHLHKELLSDNTFSGNTPNRVLLAGGSLASDALFPPSAPYELQGALIIPAGMTLTVQPGATVMGQSGVEVKVLGHLSAIGAASQPITFTSATDSGPYQWSGLVFDGGTGDLRHATVRYGGNANSILGSISGSNLTMRNVLTGQVYVESSQVLTETYSGYGYTDYGLYAINSRVVVSDTLFSGNGNDGWDYALYATGASTVLTVTGSIFQNNVSYGLYSTNGTAAWVSDSAFTGNSNYPLRVEGFNLHQALSSNLFSGNTPNRLLTSGVLSAGLALPGNNGLAGYELENDLTVPDGMTLTVQPNATVMGQSGVEVKVLGHLSAIGTSSQPITFTSATDTGPGQWTGLFFDGGTGYLRHATVRYAGNDTPIAGWAGSNITIRDVLTGQVQIESSRIISVTSPGYPDYGLYVTNGHVVVSDTLFSDNGGSTGDYALYATGISTVTIWHSTIANNAGDGIYFASGGAPAATIANSAIHDNGGYGVRNASGVMVDARINWWGDPSGPGGVGPGTGDEVSANVLFEPWLTLPDLDYTWTDQVYDAGDMVAWRNLSWVPTDPITGNARVGNSPTPDVHWSGWITFTSLPADLGSLPPTRYLEWRIFSNTVPAPGAVVVAHDAFTHTDVGDSITGDATWTAAASPYVISGQNILVYQGATLTIEPGVTVWFEDARSLQVDGTLVARGTATQPITFTSWHVQKQPDDWGLITFNDTAEDAVFDGNGNYVSGSALQYVVVEYAGVEYTYGSLGRFSYAIDAPKTTLYVDHCAIHYNGAGGVRSMGGYVTYNLVTNNTLTATQDVTGTGISNSGGGTVAYNTVTSNSSAPTTDISFTMLGGGIASSGGGMVVHNIVSGNSSQRFTNSCGGGIYSTGGGTVSDNTVTANRSNACFDSWGGGIYSRNGLVSSNVVAENSSSSEYYMARGGGIYGDSARLTRNTVTSNTAYANSGAYGGGIYSTGPYTVSNNTIAGNAAYYTGSGSSVSAMGGGIYNIRGMIESNEVRANVVTGTNSYAGGLYSGEGGAVRGNAIVSNTAQGNVGGVWWASGSGEVTYNTLAGNTTLSNTGALYIQSGYPVINHNAVYSNSGFALYNRNPASDTHVDARYNWWAVTDTTTLRNLIYDWFDDTGVGFVDYVPYLFSSPNKSPAGINVSGRAAGLVNTSYSFEASVYPIAAVKPLTFTWQATEVATTITHVVNALYDTASLAWTLTGTHIITVTASNAWGAASVTYTIDIASASSSDAYEVDDACDQAHAISTDGSTQLHTFHAAGDIDWASFTATANTIYVIEATTPDDSGADVSLEVYDACGGTPTFGQDNAFSPGVSLNFTAFQSGPLYLRLSNRGTVTSTLSAAYYVSVRALGQTATPGAVILVAGKRRDNDTLQSNIHNVTNAVYRLFLANGYTGDRIQYLADDTTLDADRDGTPDVDKPSNKLYLQQAITQWAKDKVGVDRPLTLYLMDHGAYDLFYLNLLASVLETATPNELNAWLNELEAAVPGVKVNVIVEACHSGSFIDLAQTISKAPGRVIIGSTGAYPVAYASVNGAMFSDAFIEALGRGMSLYSSFAEARWTLQQAHPDQTPWLDDDGDGTPNETEDGQEAARRGFAYAGTFGDPQWPPYIEQATMKQSTGVIAARVQAQPGKVISRTWALIYSPSYQPPPPGEDMAQDTVPVVELRDLDQDGLFTGYYAFTQPGTYRVVVYAVDDRELGARPREASPQDIGPVLSVGKSGPARANAGALITYTLAVTNSGDLPATHLVITDAIPSGASYIAGGVRVGNVVSWTASSLNASASIKLQFVVTATSASGALTNSDYVVSADGIAKVQGNAAVVTAITPEGGEYKVYLPVVLR